MSEYDAIGTMVEDLIQVAYESGYYSGRNEDGQPHHVKARDRRNDLRDKLLRRIWLLCQLAGSE